MKRVVALIMAGWALTRPASAQPGVVQPHPELDCPRQGVSAAQWGAATASATQLLQGSAEAEQARAALEPVLASVRRCGDSRRWNANQRTHAEQYALMQLSYQDMRQRYAAQHVSLDFIDEAVAMAPTNQALPFDALVARAQAQGLTGARPDSAADVVYIYMMLVAQLRAIRAGFADPSFQLR
jgi:hypothetical protein